MATFKREDADVALVLFKTGHAEKGTLRYRIAPYLLVTYDDGTSGTVPNSIVGAGNLDTTYTVGDLEFDRIEIYDGNPHGELNSFGIY